MGFIYCTIPAEEMRGKSSQAVAIQCDDEQTRRTSSIASSKVHTPAITRPPRSASLSVAWSPSSLKLALVCCLCSFTRVSQVGRVQPALESAPPMNQSISPQDATNCIQAIWLELNPLLFTCYMTRSSWNFWKRT